MCKRESRQVRQKSSHQGDGVLTGPLRHVRPVVDCDERGTPREALRERHSERGTQREALRERHSERDTRRETLRERHSERDTRREAVRERQSDRGLLEAFDVLETVRESERHS